MIGPFTDLALYIYAQDKGKKTWLDLPMRYQPYRKANTWLIRRFLK